MDESRKYKPFEFITSIFVVLLITLYLLYFDSTGYLSLFSAKASLFRILTVGYIISVIILFLECLLMKTIHFSDVRDGLKNLSLPQYAVIFYFLFTVISALISPYSEYVWFGASRGEGVFTIFLYCSMFFLVSQFFKAKFWMVALLGCSVTMLSLLCILQLHGANPFGLYPEGLNYFDAYKAYSGAYLGTIGNVDFLSAFYCLAIPILGFSVWKLENKYRWLLLIPLILALYVLIKMQVMAGYVGIFIGGLISVFVILKMPMKVRKVLLIIGLLLLVLALLFLYFVDLNVEILHDIHEILNGRIDGSLGTGRIYIWTSVLSLVPDHLFFGTGPDTMAFAEIKPFERYDESLGKTIIGQIDAAHNEYLNVLYHQGLFAFLSYILFLGSLCFRWCKRAQIDIVTAIIGSAALCYCIQAFFGISQCVSAVFFWLTLGILENSLKGGMLEKN